MRFRLAELLLGGIRLAQKFQSMRIFGLDSNGLFEGALGGGQIAAAQGLFTPFECSSALGRR